MGVCSTKKKVMLAQEQLLKQSNSLAKIPQTNEIILDFALTEPGEDSNLHHNSPQKRVTSNVLVNQRSLYSFNNPQFKFPFSTKYLHQDLKINEKQQIIHRESGLEYNLEVLENNTENRKLIQKIYNPEVQQNYFQIIEICLQNQFILVVRKCLQGNNLRSLLLEIQSNDKNQSFTINQIKTIIKVLHNLDVIHFNLQIDSFSCYQDTHIIYLDKLSDILNYSEINYQYIPPEQMNYIPFFSKESNIWSFGMIVGEILNLKNIPQFKNNLKNFKSKINKWNPQKSIPKSTSEELKIVVLQALEKDPSQRKI